MTIKMMPMSTANDPVDMPKLLADPSIQVSECLGYEGWCPTARFHVPFVSKIIFLNTQFHILQGDSIPGPMVQWVIKQMPLDHDAPLFLK